MTLLAEEFALSPDERARLDNPFFRNADEKTWVHVAADIQQRVLTAYADGEISLHDALGVVYASSIGCSLAHRIQLLALTVKQSLEISPQALKRKRPPYPTWLRKSGATLVEFLHEQYPDRPIAANEMNRYTTWILRTAIKQMTALGLWGSRRPVDARTLDRWYRRYRQDSPTADIR